MKKIIFLTLVFMLLLSVLSGCEPSNTQTDTTNETDTIDIDKVTDTTVLTDKDTDKVTETPNSTDKVTDIVSDVVTDKVTDTMMNSDTNDNSETTDDPPEETDENTYESAGVYASVLANKKQYCEINYYPSSNGTKTYNNRYKYIKDYDPDSYYDSFSRYAIVDMDGDGDIECVVEASQIRLLLFVEEDKIYGHTFGFRGMDNIQKNGTYSWHGLSEEGGLTYGERKLSLSGIECTETDLWHIDNDGEENVRYYIGDRQVTENELNAYVDGLSSEEVDWINF